MATALLLPNGRQQYFNPQTGTFLAGGFVYTYAAGTVTPQNSWQDGNQVTLNANPVALDAYGTASIFGVGNYKIAVYDSLMNLVYTQDNIASFPSQSGLLLAQRYFLASATYTPTAGTNSIVVTVVGGGGGGGGSSATAAAQCAAGPGGGGGGWAKRRITSGFAGASMVIGAAGTGGGNGTAGGTTSFGAFVSATGGAGGLQGVTASNATVSINGFAAGGVGSGGDINGLGGLGQYAVYSISPTSGQGGISIMGAGSPWVTANASPVAGVAAVAYGSGGSGGASPASSAAALGGNGQTGLVIVDEYS